MLNPIYKLFSWLAIALVLTVFLGLLSIENSTSTTPQVWVTNSMARIRLTDSLGSDRNINLYAARGEYESFQIGIKAPQNNSTVYNVQVSNLSGAGDRLIPQNNITLYREHYVNITKPSPTWGGTSVKPLGTGWYPDGLIPFVDPTTGADLANAELDAIPFQLKPEQNQAIWVDILVPRDAPAGNYQGTYTVTSDLGKATGKISLTVWNFELPQKPSLKSSFLPWEQKDKDTIIELLKHKVMPDSIIDLADERELIDKWGLTSLRLPFWSGANIFTCEMQPSPTAAKIREAGLKHQLDLMLYVYATDEIDECQNLNQPFKEWSDNIHQAGVKHLAVMSPVPELYDQVDIWAVNPSRYDAAGNRIKEVLRQGKEVWFYAALVLGGNVPNWQIDFAPINYRIPQGFINQSLGLTGLLYWRVDNWTEDPWNEVVIDPFMGFAPENHDTGNEYYPGDGMLIYPGKQVGIEGAAPSMRLKWIREGIEDYEYIEILKRWGYENWALKTVRQVATDLSHWNQDPDVLNAARLKLGAKIHQLSF
ncbi:MAG: glycoside hydrolase domain-containing protein [Cyanobacteria bacterium P01_A01_bin.40]